MKINDIAWPSGVYPSNIIHFNIKEKNQKRKSWQNWTLMIKIPSKPETEENSTAG